MLRSFFDPEEMVFFVEIGLKRLGSRDRIFVSGSVESSPERRFPGVVNISASAAVMLKKFLHLSVPGATLKAFPHQVVIQSVATCREESRCEAAKLQSPLAAVTQLRGLELRTSIKHIASGSAHR